MTKHATRPPLRPVLICFLCGVALLVFGLYRWPPELRSYTRARRSIGQQSSGASQPDFNPERAGKDRVPAVVDYLVAVLLLLGGAIFWHRRSTRGFRLSDLYSKHWHGGKGLWYFLNLYGAVTAYALLVFIGMLSSFW